MIISKLITHYRNCLNQQPESILIGEIPEGASNFNENLDFLLTPEHKEFLTLCDGGSFGDILLWGSDELLDQQYRVPDSLKDDMYEIGHILDVLRNKIFVLANPDISQDFKIKNAVKLLFRSGSIV